MEPNVSRRAAEWWADRLCATHAKKRAAFVTACVVAFDDEIARAKGRDVTLGYIDYDPEGPLLAATRAAGIECRAEGVFRVQKSGIQVRDGHLEAKEGYGAAWLPMPSPVSP